MKFLVLGTGGVGGFFGGVLWKSGHEVCFLARGSHLSALKKQGLKINSTSGNWTVPSEQIIKDTKDIDPPDVVLFCVKSYDTEEAAKQLDEALNPHTVILSLQNGIDNEEIIRRIVSRGRIFGGIAYVSSRITAPGEITETGGLQRLVFGPMHGPIDLQAKDVHEAFAHAKIKAELRQDIVGELWKKFIFISSMGSMTALTRLTHGEILASSPTLQLVFEAMQEASAVAKAHGVILDPIDPQRVIEGLRRFDSGTRSSLYFDLINEKPLEIEALNGTIVRLAEKYGINVPVHRTLYAGLLPYHRKHVQNRDESSAT